MSEYYNPNRKWNLYNPQSKEPFKLSRSKIDLFLKCPRCFYYDRKLGVGQPPSFPFTLNSAVDALLKKEFDSYRAKGQPHPLMVKVGIKAVPFKHPDLDKWRDSMREGIKYHHLGTNLLITGGIDDVWRTEKGQLIIVDYKATAKSTEVSIDADWQIAYKKQMEVYQWLFKKNGFMVYPKGCFLYCNGDISKERFDSKLEFSIKLIPYKGDDSWVEPTIYEILKCLNSKILPKSGNDCDYCKYREAINALPKMN
ncbi:MAG: PD-(D/E)XK nuclease family protein [Candidatus Omnitrophica bacterium]|nr:PD-(D/E)XK nuclease family protein [Candidatus Omnitrophota bacterium]